MVYHEKGDGFGVGCIGDTRLGIFFHGMCSEKSVLNQLLKQRDHHNDHLGQSNVQTNGTKCIANLIDKIEITVFLKIGLNWLKRET